MLYEGLLRNLIFPAGDLLFGQRMMQRLRFLEKAQYWDEGQIKDYQNQELKKLIPIVYREVPMYRKLYDEAGIDIESISTIEQLSGLPIVTKQVLRDNFPEYSTRPTGQKVYEVKTSGSTGANLILYEDHATAGWYRASFMLALEWSGWRMGDAHLQTGMTLERGLERKLKDILMKCHYFSAFDLSNEMIDMILSELEKYNLKFLWGYPESIALIARRAKERNFKHTLKSVATWGDSLTPPQRAVIEEVFATQVFDTYGTAEGIQIAAQCEMGNYHLQSFDGVLEILDDNGDEVSPGEVGRVVVTRFHPGASPLVRYEVGDLAMKANSHNCSCGRKLPILGGIRGRQSDLIITPEGNRLIVHFFTGILEHFAAIRSFQVIQESIESIRILIVPVPGAEVNHDAVVHALREKGIGSLIVSIEEVGEIPLTKAGKRKFVISHLEEN
ncbi:MAG: phenylacetate--CoA ligase family protein [Anaerolineaceae bacterium]|nr:phenylacetate--CoA ligase family protein [Anaerolineaceae bacterium]